MTTDTVTMEALSELCAALNRASADIHRLNIAAIGGEVTPAYCAKEVNRLMAELQTIADKP